MAESRTRRLFRMFLIKTLILLLSTHVSQSRKDRVFMLVLDGIVYNFKHYADTPNLDRISAGGVHAARMIPAFPADTLPSMTSLSTGLYPESHGVIANGFRDARTNTTFNYQSLPTSYSTNRRFFAQEPLWLTNQHQGGSSFVYYMPGFYACGEKPRYHNDPANTDQTEVSAGRRAIDEAYLRLTQDTSLNFVQIWLDQPDGAGHEYGVSSAQYKKALETVDEQIIGYILDKIANFTDLNLIVVADHGFNDIPRNSRHVRYLDDFLDSGSFSTVGNCGGSCFLNPEKNYSVDDLYGRLQLLTVTGNFQMYRKDDPSNSMAHLHYFDNENSAQIAILANENWILQTDRKSRTPNIGNHGYNCFHENMGTIFYASGPAFRQGVVMEPFESVNIVPLVAELIGVKARPNNGSIEFFRNVLL